LKRARRILLLIVSEDRLFRESLEFRLNAARDLRVGGATGCDKVSAQIRDVGPDLILLDLDALGPMPESLLQEIRRSHPGIPVLAVATLDSEAGVAHLLRAGVVGFVSKREPVSILLRAIASVAAGETWAPRRATAAALTGLAQDQRFTAATLTPRERELLSLLSGGYRNKELAAMLRIKEQTVKMHLHRLFQKLHVKSRVAAVLHATQMPGILGNRETGS
jgi:DNA-binding NarL/FixJ family response regulator